MDRAEPRADPLLGRVLNGRFTLQALIGSGGMGRVYRAVQSPLNRLVAVKVLSPSFSPSKDPAFRERFSLEAALTAKLRHPNTVSVIDYGQTGDGVFFIAMELLEGQTVAEHLVKQGPLSWQRCANVVQQIARSLREAHRLGIIHRDLKPANVMLLAQDAEHDVVKVLDFGLVKPLAPERTEDASVTQGGMFLGSPLYMAPEQARNQASPQSDVYSLGILMFEMLTGRVPFSAKDSIDVIVQHIQAPVPAMASLRPDVAVPAPIEHFVRRCLEKEPTRRFRSMDEFLEALHLAAGQAGSGVVFTSPPTGLMPIPSTPGPQPAIALEVSSGRVAPDARSSRRPWALAAVLLSTTVVVGFGIVFGVLALVPAEPPAVPPPVAVAAASAPPAPVPAPAPSPEPPASEAVRFRLNTVPPGATVWLGKRKLGRTPLQFELPPGPSGEATADLIFALDGYHPLGFVAGGYGPEVALTQRLAKKSEPLKSPPVAVPQDVPTVDDAAAAPVATPIAWPEPAKVEPTISSDDRAALPFSAEMTRPELLRGQSPVYTREAIAANVEGTVLARCVVTAEGALERCRLIKTLPHLDRAVLEALYSRRYRPATLHGKPVAVEYLVTMKLNRPR